MTRSLDYFRRLLTACCYQVLLVQVVNGEDFCDDSPRRASFVPDCNRLDTKADICNGFFFVYMFAIVLLMSLLFVICWIRRK